MRTKITIAQKLPREYEINIIEFHKYVINIRKKLCFEIRKLWNMDEVLSPQDRTPVLTGAALDVKPGARILITPLTV
jgi:hypothetical protein